MGIGVIWFGLVSGECPAELGEPRERQVRQEEPALGDHSTSPQVGRKTDFGIAPEWSFKGYMKKKNTLKLLCVFPW